MKRYTFKDGHSITSKITDSREIMRRLNRLDWLRVLTEGYTEGEGYSICKKAWRAYNKVDNFTGVIRLTSLEKDFLGYMLDGDMIDDHDREVINYYLSR